MNGGHEMIQDNVMAIDQARAVVERRAGKAAGDVHAAGLAADIAERVRDISALEGALIRKLEAQRDFAAEYQGMFPHGFGPGRGHKREDSTVLSFEPKAAEWCLSFGFHVRTVRRWLDLLDAVKYAGKQKAVLKKCWELAELWQAANYSSESNEWYTPAKYIEAVREVLGGIDLDPASNEQANRTVQAKDFFDAGRNGLEIDWYGRVFLNPPYGVAKIEISGIEKRVSLAGAFCMRALNQYVEGHINAGIILVNSLHSQNWQAPLYDYPICFVDHRIHFVSGDGEENENPTFQNIFVYLGLDVPRFARVFSRFGYVMQRVPTK